MQKESSKLQEGTNDGKCETSPISRTDGRVGLCLFNIDGQTWLVCVDRFYLMPLAEKLKRGGMKDVMEALLCWFHWFRWPEILHSDLGPCFRSSFTQWCNSKGINHDVSSSYFPASNSLAESGVAHVKKVIQKAQEAKQSVHFTLAEF